MPYEILGHGEILLHPQHVRMAGGYIGAQSISLNADRAQCFLYGAETGLPAPPTTFSVDSEASNRELTAILR